MTRAWALRCSLEAMFHEQNCFLNLTYAPEDLPENGTLVVKHLQDFVKRLRAHLDYNEGGKKIRYFAAGEYGEKGDRPHYHVLVFGHEFEDKYSWRFTDRGNRLYRSKTLEKLWQYGHAEIGELNWKTAGYTAGYVRKKVTGDKAKAHYEGRQPEFSIMSKKPPIGNAWYQANKSWLWKEDVIQHEGKIFRPPRAFEKLFKKEDPEGYATWLVEVKAERKEYRRRDYVEHLEEVEEDDEAEAE